jgi:hypothetical protein
MQNHGGRGRIMPHGSRWPWSTRRMSTRATVGFRPATWVCLTAFFGSVIVAVAYFAAGHLKHGLAFLALSVAAAVGVWFTTGSSSPRPRE